MGGVLTRLAVRNCFKKNTKIIYTAHGFHFYKGASFKNWLFYYPVERFLARYTDVLITINKEDYQRAKNSFKAVSVEYIPGVGVDTDKFCKIEIDSKIKRKELELPEDAFVALSVGEINRNKNHETVIKSLAKLNNINIHYIICGQGLLEKHLYELIVKLGLEKQVHLLGYRKDIAEICKVSDVFVFPSFREGLSVSLMEAMATGLPVVCSNIRGNTDLIENGEGGFLVEAGDVNKFAEYINKIYENKELREKFRRNNQNRINKYSLNNITELMTNLYKSL
jgi:glycosyltransferase EpsD